ncbi:hypothetical protein X907_1605 [Glycocaulis alkaliphilus]|uniref:Uncharacterized protein n=1 Tax=Glycocaulis alkaliphilus TaxID=1434191 RepID=A0A3T0EA80_9PROT|nr:DUF2267 domain-containing protein [Glycocaulis alkaliphilus]AZU04137.1 hypothetical protein X907_1605 [Glycocaulis alkaliphilus]GGB76178.1 hypothetical protein GCM10007417_14930 [Glycocaulis alkaliphilus]
MRQPPAVLRDAVSETCDLLDTVQARLGLSNRMHAYAALQAVLHAAREGLPASSTLRMAAGMPLFIGGLTVRDWYPAAPQSGPYTFERRVAERLPLSFPLSAPETASGVLFVLSRRMDPSALACLQASANGFMPHPAASNRPQSGQPQGD